MTNIKSALLAVLFMSPLILGAEAGLPKTVTCEVTQRDVYRQRSDLPVDSRYINFAGSGLGETLFFRKTIVDGREMYALEENGVNRELYYTLVADASHLVFSTNNSGFSSYAKHSVVRRQADDFIMVRSKICGAYNGGCDGVLMDLYSCSIN